MNYICGLRPGETIELIKQLDVRNDDMELVQTFLPGEIWEVLDKSPNDPTTLWLRRKDGKRHTWDDDLSVFE